jgi:hypothetical protein
MYHLELTPKSYELIFHSRRVLFCTPGDSVIVRNVLSFFCETFYVISIANITHEKLLILDQTILEQTSFILIHKIIFLQAVAPSQNMSQGKL